MPATPQTPPNPNQKDQKDLPPWRKRLQGWRQRQWQDWRVWVKNRINQINNKIWVLDWAIIRYNKRIFTLLDDFSFWVKKFPRNRPALISLCILPFVIAVILLCRELFIAIFPLSIIAIAPFFLSFWYIALALGFLAISGLTFFLFGPQFFIYLAQIVSSVWFLFLLLLVFVIALYHPPLADSVLSIVTEKYSGKIIPFVPAIATILGLLLFAQRLDVMNEQIETTQDQHEVDLFKQACELLGHEKMVARLGGITMLNALARTKPKIWHIKVADALAHFIRQQSADDKDSPVKGFWRLVATEEKDEKEAEEKWQELSELKANRTPADIEAAIRVIACDLTGMQKIVIKKHHKKVKRWPNLERCWLCRIDLAEAYLPKAILSDSFFTGTDLILSDLTSAIFNSSHLDSSVLTRANLRNTLFSFTNLASIYFFEKKGLGEAIFTNCYYIKGESKPMSLGEAIQLEVFEEITIAEKIEVKDYWEEARDFPKRQHFFAGVPPGEIILGRVLREKIKRAKKPESDSEG